MIQIVAAQGRIPGRGQDLEHTAIEPQNRNIESTAAEIVDGKYACGILVQAIGHRGGRGFVQQAQDIQSRQPRRILGGLALGVIEVCRHRHHSAHELATQGGFGTLF